MTTQDTPVQARKLLVEVRDRAGQVVQRIELEDPRLRFCEIYNRDRLHVELGHTASIVEQ